MPVQREEPSWLGSSSSFFLFLLTIFSGDFIHPNVLHTHICWWFTDTVSLAGLFLSSRSSYIAYRKSLLGCINRHLKFPYIYLNSLFPLNLLILVFCPPRNCPFILPVAQVIRDSGSTSLLLPLPQSRCKGPYFSVSPKSVYFFPFLLLLLYEFILLSHLFLTQNIAAVPSCSTCSRFVSFQCAHWSILNT